MTTASPSSILHPPSSILHPQRFDGETALVMGLGLNGGGLAAAKFLLTRGAKVTVTDLKDETALAAPAAELETFAVRGGFPPVRFVLGRHDIADFEAASLVVKNPIVHPDSPYLLCAKRVVSDIGLFLAENPAPLIAVTGSKGKSTTASAIHHVLCRHHEAIGRGKSYLGGNITVSPLSFVDELGADDVVTLELSSWQLGDLRGKKNSAGGVLLRPKIAVITKIMPDHQNWYKGMEPYVADKRVIYAGQRENDATITLDDDWGRGFLAETRAKKLSTAEIPPELASIKPKVPSSHQKQNLILAGLALIEHGLALSFVKDELESFPGVEHRLEFVLERGGVRFYNDSAATIPEAAALAVAAFDKPVLITGGTDKNLDFTPLADACKDAAAVVLLAGTGTDKLLPLLRERALSWIGPFDKLEAAVNAALEKTRTGGVVVFSPGCTSFGMFDNEFDRGRKFKVAIKNLV
jgi:UDP-N-acetylmuramoylalanine--D-glutamate ligase